MCLITRNKQTKVSNLVNPIYLKCSPKIIEHRREWIPRMNSQADSRNVIWTKPSNWRRVKPRSNIACACWEVEPQKSHVHGRTTFASQETFLSRDNLPSIRQSNIQDSHRSDILQVSLLIMSSSSGELYMLVESENDWTNKVLTQGLNYLW